MCTCVHMYACQVAQLSLAKEKLETINDSVQAQLEEQLDKVQVG